MRYGPEHKQRTRRRILERAGRLFRRFGYAGVGIDSIMEAADLTRGGFYGYFRSKRDLFAQVLAGEHDLVQRLRARRGVNRETLTAEALEVVAGYLAPENRERVGRGCFFASLSVDVARADRAAQAAYAERLRDLAAEFSRGSSGAASDDPRALASIALCVGGLVVARALGDDPLAEPLLAVCRERVARELAGETALHSENPG